MKPQFARLNGLLVLTAGMLFAASASAQTLNFLTTAPVPTNGEPNSLTGSPFDGGNVSDGAAYADGAANDGFTYVAFNRPSQGQTFTTGASAGRVTAIWVRQVGYTNDLALTWWDFGAGSSFTFRITDPSQVNTAGFVLDSETYTITGTEPNWPGGGVQNSATGTGLWLRFGLTNNVQLSPNTTYGFDITSLAGGGDFFETWGTSNNVYSGGTAYTGTTNGTPTNTMTTLVGDRAFLIEFNGGTFTNPPVFAPVITNQPANVMVNEGSTATFTVGADGTPPFAYQWYFNTNTMLTGQTNATLTVAGTPANVGAYSVVLTNDSGSDTSSGARLSVVLPSYTTNVNVSAGGGNILDMNGVSTPFSVRLAGTGASIATDDPNLEMTADGMNITSANYDFNGQANMGTADAPGINLSSLIGFDGTQDFSVSGTFTNLVAFENYDQIGLFLGITSTNLVRAGEIWNSDFAAEPGGYGVGTFNSVDNGIVVSPSPSAPMVVTIARSAGVWSVNVDGMSVTPNTDLSYLNTATDLTAGVFAIETAGLPLTYTVTGMSASLFSAPKLTVTPGGGNLTFNWNVLSQGLESSTNLSDPNSWTLVPGTGNINQFIMTLPTASAKFYRIAP